MNPPRWIKAIDPGSKYTGYSVISIETLLPYDFGKVPNEELIGHIIAEPTDAIHVIEVPMPRGQKMSWQLVDTIRQIGRIEAHLDAADAEYHTFDRKDVKMQLLGTIKGNDSQISAAVRTYYEPSGGGSMPEKGTAKQPGPLFGFSHDVWQAHALGLAYIKMHNLNPMKLWREWTTS